MENFAGMERYMNRKEKRKGNDMNDYKGNKFDVGDVFRDNDDEFSRVIFVGKELIGITHWCKTLETAFKNENLGYDYNQKQIKGRQFTIVQKASLGVFDKEGKEYRIGCIADGFEVFGAVKSLKESDCDWFLHKDKRAGGGWSLGMAKKYEITSYAYPEKEEDMIDIGGTMVSKATIKEALKRFADSL